jgi:tRNA-specific 2-thiouridylase
VIDPFVEAYRKGMTPNPCILCNEHIKFPYLLRAADEAGAGFIATGHYARIEKSMKGKDRESLTRLKKGIDRKKDQSYVLHVLDAAQLDRLILPLGELTKDEVRRIARTLNLPAAERPESQEICFIEDNDYCKFLEVLAPDALQSGPVVGPDGVIIGTHQGIYRYTIGQRKGLGIASLEPRYVTKIDALHHTVHVGSREDAMVKKIEIKRVHWLVAPDSPLFRASVKVRSMMEPKNASIEIRDEQATVLFDEPQWAPAPGQSAVIYEDETVLGGGTISSY